MFGSERNELRQLFFTAWKKHQDQLPVDPIEAQLIEIILQHPEYHALLNNPELYQEKDFIEENPFLHLSLHLALREQVSTNRPLGIQAVYQGLCVKFADGLMAEHSMIECLEKVLWEAQRSHKIPDEGKYLEDLSLLLRS